MMMGLLKKREEDMKEEEKTWEERSRKLERVVNIHEKPSYANMHTKKNKLGASKPPMRFLENNFQVAI